MKFSRINLKGLMLLVAMAPFLAGAACSGGGGDEPTTYTVSGRVTEDGSGVAGVVISFSGGFSSVTTGSTGQWSKADLQGTVTVTPSKIDWSFNPASRQVSGAASDVDFTGVQSSTYTVLGRITVDGVGLPGVLVSFGGVYPPDTTDSNGNWGVTGLQGTITITPSKSGWSFEPPNRQVSGTATDVNFIGSLIVAPAAPTELTVTAKANDHIDLSWVDNANNEDGFRIRRKMGSGTYSTLDTVDANTTTYSDTDVYAGKTYYYQVYAYNSAGSSTYSNEVHALALDPFPPAAPSSLYGEAVSSTSIDLSWQDNSNNETSFILQRKLGASGVYKDIPIDSCDIEGQELTYYTDTGLTEGTYYYRIKSCNIYGESSYSDEIIVIITT